MSDAYCTWIFTIIANSQLRGAGDMVVHYVNRTNADSFEVVHNLISRGGMN